MVQESVTGFIAFSCELIIPLGSELALQIVELGQGFNRG